MKVSDVRRNLVPDTWTADGEGALPELLILCIHLICFLSQTSITAICQCDHASYGNNKTFTTLSGALTTPAVVCRSGAVVAARCHHVLLLLLLLLLLSVCCCCSVIAAVMLMCCVPPDAVRPSTTTSSSTGRPQPA